MYRLAVALQRLLVEGQVPIAYIIVSTDMGQAVYSDQMLPDSFSASGYFLSDAAGLFLSDAAGLFLASNQFTVSEARVIDFGSVVRTLIVDESSRLGAVDSQEKASYSFSLDNTDKAMSKKIAKEPFISKTVQVKMGERSLPIGQHFTLFEGVIEYVTISEDAMDITVVEE
jgi:hypothetical protein